MGQVGGQLRGDRWQLRLAVRRRTGPDQSLGKRLAARLGAGGAGYVTAQEYYQLEGGQPIWAAPASGRAPGAPLPC